MKVPAHRFLTMGIGLTATFAWAQQADSGGMLIPRDVSLAGLEFMVVAPGDCILDDTLFNSEEGGCRDLTTGLVWSTQSLQFGIQSTWEGAKTYCEDLVEGGYDDWFLPSRDELQEVFANGSATHMNLMTNSNWSSTRRGNTRAWLVNLTDGNTWVDLIGSTRNCICARIPTPPPPPSIDVETISPSSMAAGSAISVTITGSAFALGAGLSFENGSGPAPQASNVNVAPDGLSLTADLSVGGGGPPGTRTWDVRLTNPDDSTGVLEAGFTVVK